MQIGAKDTQNYENGPWNHENSDLCKKTKLQYLRCKMLSLPILDIQIQTQKPLEKEAWKQASLNTHCLIQGTQKAFKMVSPTPVKINKN